MKFVPHAWEMYMDRKGRLTKGNNPPAHILGSAFVEPPCGLEGVEGPPDIDSLLRDNLRDAFPPASGRPTADQQAGDWGDDQ